MIHKSEHLELKAFFYDNVLLYQPPLPENLRLDSASTSSKPIAIDKNGVYHTPYKSEWRSIE